MIHRRLYHTACAAVLLLCTGCGFRTIPAQQITPDDVYFDAPPERVWYALLEAYTDRHIPIDNMDRSSWFLRSNNMYYAAGEDAADMFDCGATKATGQPTIERAQSAGVSASVTTLLRPSGSGTSMRSRVFAITDPFRPIAPVRCYSEGHLEQIVAREVADRLGVSAAPSTPRQAPPGEPTQRSSVRSEAPTETPATPTSAARWIAASDGTFFYWHECDEAKAIPSSRRLVYPTRAAAERSGRTLSLKPECQGPQ